MSKHTEPCPEDGRDYHGRCAGSCFECGEHLLTTGRYTAYCPDCDTCPECGCPNADGFSHYAECKSGKDDDETFDDPAWERIEVNQ